MQALIFNEINIPSATLQIRGPDANTYLQGQFSQQLRAVAGSCAYGLWLNQKGRVVADSFVLCRASNDYLVWSPCCQRSVVRERLEGYLVADEVEIAEATGDFRAVLVWGAGAADAIRARYGAVPEEGAFVGTGGEQVFRGRGPAQENFVCLTNAAAALASEFERLGAGRGDGEALEAERIAGGFPAVPADIGPEDLPNEGGLETVAISYTKGCYLGQEVMSRLKNLGQVRRRLFVVAGHGAKPAPLTAMQQGGKIVGHTRSSATTCEGFVAMAMLSLVNLDRAAPLALADGRAVELRHG